ncbi:hypothetical protein PROFUN_03028 [Planoprotostelium fungivorum]|uniref:Uncharacterized protein n=1 Tax=Planoprotostelium fungivorum TaxID=1890364 RepID=A0A2P6NXE0_9EUKA|nr:hypothetical protein PROFUN_03028 [Planoprotostelium fungivorum]
MSICVRIASIKYGGLLNHLFVSIYYPRVLELKIALSDVWKAKRKCLRLLTNPLEEPSSHSSGLEDSATIQPRDHHKCCSSFSSWKLKSPGIGPFGGVSCTLVGNEVGYRRGREIGVYTCCAGGAFSAASSVALGAFGAHGLKNYVTDKKLLSAYETAAHYHMAHSLAILFASTCIATHTLSDPRPRLTPAGHLSAGLFLAGCGLFSGSLYAMAALEERRLGIITPFGGLCFIAGWATLAFSRGRALPLK